ncbi:Mitochondrial intermediate peptidase [Irineochytrium annulatum]|nr:Mitochondrial intermediate peptidase [Irineochytrium annulatum]
MLRQLGARSGRSRAAPRAAIDGGSCRAVDCARPRINSASGRLPVVARSLCTARQADRPSPLTLRHISSSPHHRRLRRIHTESPTPQPHQGLRAIDPENDPLVLLFDSPKRWAEHRRSAAAKAAGAAAERVGKPGPGRGDARPRGLFGYADLAGPDGFQRAARRAVEQAKRLVDVIVADPGGRLTVKRLDRLSDMLCCILDAAELIQHVHPRPEVVRDANRAHAELSNYLNQLNTHQGLYESLKAVLANEEMEKRLNEEERRVAHLLMVDFEKSGITMPADKRDMFVALNDQVLAYGQAFAGSAYPSTLSVEIENASKRLDGVPPDIKRSVTTSKRKCKAGYFSKADERRDIASIPTCTMAGVTVLRTARDESVRKALFVGMNSADAEQLAVLTKLLKTRARLARLVGGKSYADLYLSDKMAASPDNVISFLESLASLHKPLAQADITRLARVKAAHTGEAADTVTIHAWDRFFYGQFLSPVHPESPMPSDPLHPHHRAHHSTPTDEYIAEHLTAGQSFAGLSALLTSLYGVRLVPSESLADGEVWDEDVRKLDVVHETEGLIGVVYCDCFRREAPTSATVGHAMGSPGQADKDLGAAQFTIRCSRRIDDDDEDRVGGPAAISDKGETRLMRLEDVEKETVRDGKVRRHQLPVVVLVTAFSRPRGEGAPSLLSLMEVETLFHEMGHVMHSMFARTDHQHIAGTRCPLDFVEVPSNFMEQFARHPAVLSTFAFHYATREPMDLSRLAAYRAANKVLSSLEVQTQLQMALLDQLYHRIPATEDEGTMEYDTTAVLKELQNRVNVIPYVDGTAWQVQFSHLYGYGASYYSYFWARRWSGRVYRRWFGDGTPGGKGERGEEPLMIQPPGCPTPRRVTWREAGEYFRRELLACGGGRDPWVGLEKLGVVRETDRNGRMVGDVLLVVKECYVYRATDWDVSQFLWQGRLRVIAKGDDAFINLEDSTSGELFAVCPYKLDGSSVEPVSDSSRYFVLTIVDRGSGKHAFVGMGFPERSMAFDFNVALQDHVKRVKNDKEAASRPKFVHTGPKVDYSLKDDQKIKINIGIGGKPKKKTEAKDGDAACELLLMRRHLYPNFIIVVSILPPPPPSSHFHPLPLSSSLASSSSPSSQNPKRLSGFNSSIPAASSPLPLTPQGGNSVSGDAFTVENVFGSGVDAFASLAAAAGGSVDGFSDSSGGGAGGGGFGDFVAAVVATAPPGPPSTETSEVDLTANGSLRGEANGAGLNSAGANEGWANFEALTISDKTEDNATSSEGWTSFE